MNREIPTFKAKCQQCGHSFQHPSLGNFAYGEAILSTADGKHFAVANAFNDFPKRLGELVVSSVPGAFWSALALLADPIAGQHLVAKIVCPGCASTSLEYWCGEKVGSQIVPEATFHLASGLDDSILLQKLNQPNDQGWNA